MNPLASTVRRSHSSSPDRIGRESKTEADETSIIDNTGNIIGGSSENERKNDRSEEEEHNKTENNHFETMNRDSEERSGEFSAGDNSATSYNHEEDRDDGTNPDCPFHNSSSNTVNSSTTSQTSSTGSRKSRRSGPRNDKTIFRTFDPMQVITPEQLEGFSLLVTTPIWIFDFIERRNRYANPAGLDLWSAPSLEEFLNRKMNDMSAASVARTQECQNRVERAQVVQDMWTFFPKGKARTVQMTMTAVRLSADEDHCSILVVANMTTASSSASSCSFGASKSSISSASSSVHSASNAKTSATVTTASASVSTLASTSVLEPSRDSSSKQSLSFSTTTVSAKKTIDPNEELDVNTTNTSCKSNGNIDILSEKEETKEEKQVGEDTDGNNRHEEKDAEEDFCDPQDDDTIPMNHILEPDSHASMNHHHMTGIDEDNPVNQEILRGVEIIRHLPMAVCQFDMKGRVMFQNPAAYLPALDDEEEKQNENDDDEESLLHDMDTDDESGFYEQLFDPQYGGLSSNNGRGNFMDRFVNKKVARELLEGLQDAPKKGLLLGTISSTTYNTTTVSIEAELHTSTKGRTQWCAIQLRKTKDPVTSRPVILYSAQDKSDAMEAKREREARLQKSEFLAIMAHEIRTPLHQVTGFIDLLELDACSNITTASSAGAMKTNSKTSSFDGTDSSIRNAIFPHITIDNTMGRKVRSTSMIDARQPRSSWPASGNPHQPIGNLTGEQRNYIKLLKSSANQLMTVISDVLDYSKLEAGKMKIERIPFELLSVVQGSMEAVRGSCEEKGLTLTLEYGGSDDNDEDEEGNGEDETIGNRLDNLGVDSPSIDLRKQFRRRSSIDKSSSFYLPPRRKKIGRTHSFGRQKSKDKSHPNIRTNNIPFRILGDPNRLRQVLLNLLSNAIKFTEKGGIHVRVSSSTKKWAPPATRAATTRHKNSSISPHSNGKLSLSTSSSSTVKRKEEGKAEMLGDAVDSMKWNSTADNVNSRPRCLKIVVSDTGMGISKEQQDTIFEKYQQANLSVARNFGGTGLGLSICKLLVEDTMGGSIGVDSDESRGSSFYITLPIEVPRETNDEASGCAIGGKDSEEVGASMKILVAEDNKINQKLVANMLKRMGHRSILVDDGRQAIDMIEKQNSQNQRPFDAVLMDIQMPVMDGLEATRRLRTMGYTDLPIVGLTASVKRSDYVELGFNDWLPKPILMKDLKAKLLKLHSDHSEDSDESSSKVQV